MVKRIYFTGSGLPWVPYKAVSRMLSGLKQLSLLFKVTNILLLSLIPLTVSVLMVSRMGIPSDIYTPPQAYLPGNPLPLFSGGNICATQSPNNLSCLVRLDEHEIYWNYQLDTHKIIRTTITADNTIGDLIFAWGTPTGFDQYGNSIVVSWGARSALLVTDSFQPYSRIRFIQYDTEPLKRSRWRGFVIYKYDGASR